MVLNYLMILKIFIMDLNKRSKTMQKILTLYLNSQTEAENNDEIYEDQWKFYPYESSSFFCQGRTKETADFILPPNYYLVEKKGKISIVKSQNEICTLITDKFCRPALYISDKYPLVVLHRADEIQPTQPESKSEFKTTPLTPLHLWIPGYDENGNLEIF